MKKNIGTLDRIIRLAIAISILILAFTNVIPSNFSILGYTIAILLILTSLIRFCPIYFPFGYRTTKLK